MRPARVWSMVLAAVCLVGSLPGVASAQRRGGMGGPGGAFPLSRMEMLTENFKLEGDKKKAVHTILDDAQKSAEPVRLALLAAHADLGAAVLAGKSGADLEALSRAYATQAAAMTRIEMQAIAKVLGIADPELKNTTAIQAAFFMARGMFLKKGKWDEIPERNVPGY